MQKKTVCIIYIIVLMMCFFGCTSRDLSISSYDEQKNTEQDVAEEEKTDITEENINLNTEENINLNTEEKEINTEDDTLCVYVCGAVKKEGVYYLETGSIKLEALDMAGGYSEDAAKGYINLAERVLDGEKIYFPYEDEVGKPMLDATGDNNNEGNNSEDNNNKNTLVNLNSATKEELMTLPGIGESKAVSIIKYREEHNGFKSIEEIKNINGIKDGVYLNIKDLIII